MVKINLPDVTLVVIETREYALALLAVEDCLRQVEFGDILILTDCSLEFTSLTRRGYLPRFHMVPDWSDKLGWCRSSWFDVPKLVRTSHMLMVQWDAGVWDAGMWRPEYLDYDYIGAPWWHPVKNVGNSGFCLKSMALARYVRDRRDRYPCDSHLEDDLLCRKYRPTLEDAGFLWAPERVAYDFAYEGCAGNPPTKHFGFHACQNFRHVLDHDRLIERARLMEASPYIRDSYMWQNFSQMNSEIVGVLRSQPGDRHVVSELRAAE